MATGVYNQSLSTSSGSPTNLFIAASDGGRVMTVCYTARPTNVGYAMIRVKDLHKAGEEFPLAPGQTMAFRRGQNGIEQVDAYAKDGAAAVDGGAIAEEW